LRKKANLQGTEVLVWNKGTPTVPPVWVELSLSYLKVYSKLIANELIINEGIAKPAVVDLAVVRPDGTELPENEEETKQKAVAVVVNVDDDDADGGEGAHSQTVIISDKDDAQVDNENDLIALRIHAIPELAGSVFTLRLVFSNAHIAVWRNANKTTAVQSKSRFAVDEDVTLYIEGKSACSPPETIVPIVLQLLRDDTIYATDSAFVTVPKSIFLFAADPDDPASVHAYLNSAKKDTRTDPYILGKASDLNGAKAVYVWSSEKQAKIALSTPGAYVAFSMHSNFGLGFAFDTGFSSVTDFMNCSEELVGIDWAYLRASQGHPALDISDNDPEPCGLYGDDPNTQEPYDPHKYVSTFTCGHESAHSYEWPHFSSAPAPGAERLHLTRGADRFHDYHWSEMETPSEFTNRLLVKSGSADMPRKRWSKVLLSTCSSGRYYATIFNHGTLFFSTTGTTGGMGILRTFADCMIGGFSDEETTRRLNQVEDAYDFIRH